MRCTNAEIAGWFDCTEQAVDNRIAKDNAFRAAIAQGRATGCVSVRRAQMKMLEKGNATMRIWLGKQPLGQRDMVASEISGPEGKPLETGAIGG
ncbi:MAG TPA: hypothetical protein VM120_27760 [Bryobacteraceae bacterium]|nr:hypothetical protein [Bryobacteraceae bacterium]